MNSFILCVCVFAAFTHLFQIIRTIILMRYFFLLSFVTEYLLSHYYLLVC